MAHHPSGAMPVRSNHPTLLREIAEVGFNCNNLTYEGKVGAVAQLCEQVHLGPECRGAMQRTTVHIAAHLGNKEFLEWLFQSRGLGRQIKTETLDIDNATCLRMATDVGALDCVNYLIKRGARCDTVSHMLELPTPLSSAMEMGRLDIVDVLCKQPGVNLDPEDSGCRAALRMIMDNTQKTHDAPRIITGLLRRCDELCETVVAPLNMRMLSYAVRRGKIACVISLLEAGASDDEPLDVTYWLPIHVAASFGYGEILQILIHARKKRLLSEQHGASNKKKSGGAIATTGASSSSGLCTQPRRYFATVEEALGPKDNHGMSPILVAAMHGHVHCVEILVQAGASTQDRSDTGFNVENLLRMCGKVDKWTLRSKSGGKQQQQQQQQQPSAASVSFGDATAANQKQRKGKYRQRAEENMSRRQEELQLMGELLAME